MFKKILLKFLKTDVENYIGMWIMHLKELLLGFSICQFVDCPSINDEPLPDVK